MLSEGVTLPAGQEWAYLIEIGQTIDHKIWTHVRNWTIFDQWNNVVGDPADSSTLATWTILTYVSFNKYSNPAPPPGDTLLTPSSQTSINRHTLNLGFQGHLWNAGGNPYEFRDHGANIKRGWDKQHWCDTRPLVTIRAGEKKGHHFFQRTVNCFFQPDTMGSSPMATNAPLTPHPLVVKGNTKRKKL